MTQSTGCEHLPQTAGGAQSLAPSIAIGGIPSDGGTAASSSITHQAGGDAEPERDAPVQFNLQLAKDTLVEDIAMPPDKIALRSEPNRMHNFVGQQELVNRELHSRVELCKEGFKHAADQSKQEARAVIQVELAQNTEQINARYRSAMSQAEQMVKHTRNQADVYVTQANQNAQAPIAAQAKPTGTQ